LLLKGIDGGEDIDRDMLAGIYDRTSSMPFKPAADHVTQVMKVEQMIIGKKPVSCKQCHAS
jgi:IQ motif/SEC7 domain-containing protein